MNSVEKVRAMLESIRDAEPETEQEAQQVALLGTVLPLAVGYLPDEPAELDALLAKGSEWALSLLSDDAPAAITPGQSLESTADDLPEEITDEAS